MFRSGDAVILPNKSGLANYPAARFEPAKQLRKIYISGTSSRLPDGEVTGVKENNDGTLTFDVQAQTWAILRNLEDVIKHATRGRGGLHNIIDATVFLADMSAHYTDMNAVWNLVWPVSEIAPARTVIGVKELPSPKMVVEIKCIAVAEVQDK